MIHPVDLNDGAADVATFDGDESATPQDLFDALNEKYHFVHDCCASAANTKVPDSYWTKTDDARLILGTMLNGNHQRLQTGWWWNNPPYSKPNLPYFTGIHRTAASLGMRSVLLIPATPGAGWFQDNVLGGADLLNCFSIDRGPLEGKVLQFSAQTCRIEVNLLRGRQIFVRPDGSNAAKTDSALVRYFPRGVNW